MCFLRHALRTAATKRGRLCVGIAALFAVAFLVPSGRITEQNLLVTQEALFSSAAPAPGASATLNGDATKTLPPPLLANLVMLDAEYSLALSAGSLEDDEEGTDFYLDTLPSVQGIAFIESVPPSLQELAERTDTYHYVVESGDTPTAIADLFGISLDTLLWANNLTSRSIIRPGDTLTILPVNGVSHTAASGDTISSLAKKYNASTSDIVAYNNLSEDAALTIGDVLVIPGGVRPAPKSVVVKPTVVTKNTINAPAGWLIKPAPGYNPRRGSGLHGFNGIDITNSCGTPIVAAAAGLVIVADDIGWNGGYGKYVKVQHPNGVVTLYGHAQELLVGEGVYIGQGEGIALMGSSGRSTGCHVHFEVRGARNPFVY